MKQIALVVGASGIVGSNLAKELISNGWPTYGLSRSSDNNVDGLLPAVADLLDPGSLTTALANVHPTHIFITSWMRQETEAENIRVNSAMVRNLLNVLSSKQSVRHVAVN
jgi:nucleoside-diphosphate-sugar epimerase